MQKFRLRITAVGLLSLLSVAAGLLINPTPVYAVTNNSAHIPAFFPATYSNFEWCNGWNPAGNDHAQAFWISNRDDSTVYQNVTISNTQNTLPLQLNTAAAVCNRNVDGGGNIIRKELTKTLTFYNQSPTVNIPGIGISGITTSSQNVLDYGCSNFANLRYIKECSSATVFDVNRVPVHNDFTLSNLSSLSDGTHNVSVTAYGRLVNEFNVGGVVSYRCVANNAPAPNFFGLNCPVTEITRTITIIKQPTIPQDFELAPVVTCRINNAGEGIVNYRVNKVSGTGLADNITIGLFYVLSGSPEQQVPQANVTVPNGGWTYGSSGDLNIGAMSPGQTLDGRITISPSSSDTNGVRSGNLQDVCDSPPVRTAKPYLRVYGHDTVVGLPFPDPDTGVCSTGKVLGQDIETFSSNVGGNYVGSGSQFAASATGAINNFISASLRNNDSGAPKPPAELSFGNVNAPVGGDLSAYRGCIPDYISELDDSSFNTVTTTLPGAGAGDDVGVNYYAQDITILSNIIDESFPSSGNWDNLEQLQKSGFGAGFPVVIVKGNINIRPGVGEINAILIAIPDSDGNGGEINTCALSVANTRRECENQLVVNGALVAKKVNFDRLNGDVANASSDELSNPNIAEVINFRPELFLALSKHDDLTNLSRKNQYESIVGLPPVL